MVMNENIVVPEERAGLELDEYLCLLYPGVHKGFLRREVREGRILVDGEEARASQKLRSFQVLSLDTETWEERMPAPPQAADFDLPVLYEDEHVLVLDKPAGLAVEPERWARENASVAGSLLVLAQERSESAAELEFRPRLVHRLDKDTSGVLIAAKDLEAERALREAFDGKQVRKHYVALVEGEYALEPGEEEVIDLPLGPDARRSGRQIVVEEGGKPSRTRVSIWRRFRGYTALSCEPVTGRTHQIRVHLAARGFPLAVDATYGRRDALRLSEIKPGYRAKRGRSERPLISRLTLHALSVTFPCPQGGREITVEAPLPKDFSQTLKQLSKVRPWTS